MTFLIAERTVVIIYIKSQIQYLVVWISANKITHLSWFRLRFSWILNLEVQQRLSNVADKALLLRGGCASVQQKGWLGGTTPHSSLYTVTPLVALLSSKYICNGCIQYYLVPSGILTLFRGWQPPSPWLIDLLDLLKLYTWNKWNKWLFTGFVCHNLLKLF